MGFPVPYAGILPKLLLTAAISVAALKEFCHSILESVGLYRDSDPRDPSWHFNPQIESDFNIRRIAGSSAPAIRASLPPVLFETLPDASDDTQCAVCLSEFRRGQEIRQLPYCCHIFHKDCIDNWLDHDQTTCPLCRSSLVTEEVARQEKARQQQISDELTSWFSSLRQEEGFDETMFESITGSRMVERNMDQGLAAMSRSEER